MWEYNNGKYLQSHSRSKMFSIRVLQIVAFIRVAKARIKVQKLIELSTYNAHKQVYVVAAQFAERLLPTPEVCGSNPVICKILCRACMCLRCLQSTVEWTKIVKKRPEVFFLQKLVYFDWFGQYLESTENFASFALAHIEFMCRVNPF